MTNQPLVSIVLPTYNRACYLKKAIDSVLNQSYQNFQLIVVDDGSEDNTKEVVTGFKDNRVEYYPLSKNRNICYALNYGLQHARGNYVARLDSDDEFEPDKLIKQVCFLQMHPEYKICFTKVKVIDEAGNDISQIDSEFAKMYDVNNMSQEEWIRKFFFQDNCLAHDAVLFEKNILDQVGGYHMCYLQLQDYDLWLRIVKLYPIYIIEEPLLKVRRFLNSDTDNITGKTEAMVTRTGNELRSIRSTFFDGMTDELFLRTFKQYFRKSDAKTEIELNCEKVFLHFRKNPEIAMGILEGLLNDRKYLQVLEEEYDYSLKDFYRMNAQAVRNGGYQYKKQLDEIYQSTSWKVSAPIRWIGKFVKGR